MNFVGKFDAKLPVDGPDAHSVMHAHVDGASTHAPSDAIIVPDAQLLFGGDFKRSGVDLVLSNDDHELVLHDYFKGEKRAALASPDGAHLTGDLVNALAGHVEYAQADGGAAAAAAVVGHVTKLTGTATAIRNGVSIILNQGDNIDKGDVLQSGADTTLGVTFIDGTVFGLSSNARMVVNEMVYDPNGSNNSSLLSLVAGTISFVAGETAKHGDMKVDTPVATMGIRGTAVLVEINFDVPGPNGTPSANFQVLTEPDGSTGSYILFDKNTLAPLATVNTAGTLTKISQGVVSFEAGTGLSPDEQKLIQDLFTNKFGDANPKSFEHYTDSPIPTSLVPIYYVPSGPVSTPTFIPAASPASSFPSFPGGSLTSLPHIPGAPHVGGPSQSFNEAPHVSGNHAPHTLSAPITFTDPNSGDRPTVAVEFNSFTYHDAHGNNLTTLTAQEKAAIAAVEGISVQQNAGNTNNGSATWTYSFPDSAFDFLGAGQTLTLTYTALVSNNYAPSPETGTAQFTITITGTNDVPVITSSVPQAITFAGGTNVAGGDLTTHAPTSGTIAFDDPDLIDTHTVSVQLVLNGLNLPQSALQILEKALTASIAADSTGTGLGTVNWQLADLPASLIDSIPKGQTITLTYEVMVTDSQGATAIQDITVKITDAAEIWIATTPAGEPSGGLWSNGANWETGNVPTVNDDVIITTNQLIGLTPSYPVTIDAATAAVAKSVTMSDFGTSSPELVNLGSLTVSGAFDMSADSIFHNSGTVSVGGLMDVVDESVLLNSGALNLRDGGDFGGQSTITNTGTGLIEISGGTLNVQVGIANDGQIKIDPNATLMLGFSTVAGGIVTNNGTVELTGAAVLKNGTLTDSGQIDVSGFGNALDNERVTIDDVLTIVPTGTLTIDQGSTVTNTGIIGLDDSATGIGELTVNDATIDGGSILNSGAIKLTGGGVLENGSLWNFNYILFSGLGNALHNETVAVGGALEILPGGELTIDQGSTVTYPYSLEVDAGTLTLNDATINTGVVYNDPGGTIDLTGGAVLKNGWLYNVGQLNVSGAGNALHNENLSFNATLEVLGSGALTIDQGTIVVNSGGTVTVDGGGTLTLNDVTVTGGTVTNRTNGTIDLTGTAVLQNGTLGNSGQVNVSNAGNALDDEKVTNTGAIDILALGKLTLDQLTTVANVGGTITVDGGGALTLNDAVINGGIINDYSLSSSASIVAGDIDVTGSSTISNAHLNNGDVTIASGQTLTLSGDVVTGTSFIDTAGGAAILIHGSATLDEVTITGGTITNSGATLTVDADQTLTLQGGVHLVGGTLSNSGTLHIESSAGATLDGVTVTGSGHIQVDVAASAATLVLDDGTAITGGTLTVGPLGTLAVKTAGGATLNGVDVTNEKSIEVFAGGVLMLDQVTTVDNSTGVISIDGTGMLTLDDAAISGGAVINSGTLTLDGKAALKSGSLLNFSQINVSGTVNELDNENVTNAGAMAILALGVLTLDHLATINNTGGLITVYGTGTLALNDATVNGGTINNYSVAPSSSGAIVGGDIDVTGSSTIGAAYLNNGQVTIESGVTLTLDDDTVTGTHFADTAGGAIIQVDGDTTLSLSNVSIDGGVVNDFSTNASGSVVAGDIDIAGSSTIRGAHLNNGQVTIESGVVLTLDNDTVTGTHFTDTADGATIQVDGGTTLKLDGVIINGGTINDFSTDASGNIIAGDIDITGPSVISDASLNHGKVTVESGQKLTLDGDTVNGTAFTNVATGSVIHVDGGDSLTLNDTTTITGGGLTIDTGALVKTSGDVTLTNTSVTNDGKIEVTGGILKITGSVGDSAPGGSGSIQIDNGAVLDLNGSDTQNVTFAGGAGKLQIDASSFGGSISGLTAGDQIDLSTIGYGLNTTGTYSNGVLTITDGVHSISMTLTGDYSNAHFAGSSDGHGGTLITLNANDDAPAFAAADKSESATVTELANTTGSSASDPSPAASGTLHFTDIDLTDRPTPTITQTVTLTDGTTTLSSSEIQALEHAFTLTEPVNTNNGSLGWTYQISDSALDFLGAGEKATVTSTITLDDHHGGTDTATVTVTVDGANDLPTIVAETDPSVETVILNKSPIVLSAGVNTNSLELPTETFDNLPAGFALINGFGRGDFTSAALDATFTASGAAGIVHGSSLFTAAPFVGPLPGHADTTNYLSIGAHASETISFGSEQNEFGLYWGSADSFNTISFYDGNNLIASYSGADVAPLLANGSLGTFASNGYVEFSDLAPFDKVVLASGSNAFEVDNISSGFVSDSHIHLADPITGTLTVSDADIGDTLTASVTGNAVAEYNGSPTLPSDVNVSALIDSGAITFDTVKTGGGQDVLDWTYNPTNADLDFLEPGDKLTLTFNALVSDGHATTQSQPLTVTLIGSNAPVVNGTAQNDTFVNVGGGATIFGNGGQDTFVFNKNFGSATISDFNVNTDTIEIDKSLFATVSALLQGAQSANSGHDTIITDAAHDHITLSGVTLAQLQAHPNDFHLI